ncbi:type II secretion system protein [Sulfurovum sp. XGS-02]|uniref:type II secretion system protein n=1 Tax=Sulfurovum sp. XGS-02 TaxID=2925411 RepID=UPI00205B3560|nr:type II secretion system protein [Sulfurovum sp. XGS-02]UPT77138.1 type II secretion system protein [Sulfurovum sp. XGS-02]
MRNAFSMLTAIFIIVLMATVAAFIMNLSGKIVKETTAQFQREQSALLAKSYTEYAIMAVTANEHNSSTCLNNITGAYGDSDGDGVPDIYNIDVNISYIGNTNLHANCNTLSNGVITEKSPLSIIIDVFVSYKDLDHPDNLNVTYHRRSLQKI